MISKIVAVMFLLFSMSSHASDWASDPNNWNNSQSNWENNPSNWRNSPSNWDNSPSKWANSRVIRDNSGNPDGYVVQKPDGGANIYRLNGDRSGYLPRR